jgi:hypothetical protein
VRGWPSFRGRTERARVTGGDARRREIAVRLVPIEI